MLKYLDKILDDMTGSIRVGETAYTPKRPNGEHTGQRDALTAYLFTITRTVGITTHE